MTNPYQRQLLEAGEVALANGPVPQAEIMQTPLSTNDPYEQLARRYHQSLVTALYGVEGVSLELVGSRQLEEEHFVMGRVLGLAVDGFKQAAADPTTPESLRSLHVGLSQPESFENLFGLFAGIDSGTRAQLAKELGVTGLDYFLLRKIVMQTSVLPVRIPAATAGHYFDYDPRITNSRRVRTAQRATAPTEPTTAPGAPSLWDVPQRPYSQRLWKAMATIVVKDPHAYLHDQPADADNS